MEFGTFLSALLSRGDVEAAEYYADAVAECLGGRFGDWELFDLEVSDLARLLYIVDDVQSANSCFVSSPLQLHVRDLQARGFSVQVGAKYRCLL